MRIITGTSGSTAFAVHSLGCVAQEAGPPSDRLWLACLCGAQRPRSPSLGCLTVLTPCVDSAAYDSSAVFAIASLR